MSLIQVKLFSSIYFPSHFPEISPETLSHQYISTQAFDPFWGFYSAKILSSQNPKLLEFIHYHLRKSPPPLLKAFSTRVEGFPKLIKKIENRQSRSHDFLSHVTPRGCKPIRFEDYLERVNNKAPGFLIFDGPSGLISFNQNQARIAPDTLPHKVLTHLFVSYPLSIDLDELYTAAWGTSFDSECDSGPLKSVLQRLRKVLSSVNPGIRVCRKRTNSKYGGVCLSMSCCWEAIV
ncbi:hypothetical protein HYY75_03390 [bacterium]|nr:hypothetical protein [bacterium]